MALRKPENDSELQKVAEQWVRRHDILNVHKWVEDSMGDAHSGVLLSRDDRQAQWDNIQNLHKPIVCKFCHEEIVESGNGWESHMGRECEYPQNLAEAYGGIDFDSSHTPLDEDPEEKEISQWYLVSKDFYEVAKECGQPVIENDYGYFWGRIPSGQAFHLDGWIEKYCSDLAWIEG